MQSLSRRGFAKWAAALCAPLVGCRPQAANEQPQQAQKTGAAAASLLEAMTGHLPPVIIDALSFRIEMDDELGPPTAGGGVLTYRSTLPGYDHLDKVWVATELTTGEFSAATPHTSGLADGAQLKFWFRKFPPIGPPVDSTDPDVTIQGVGGRLEVRVKGGRLGPRRRIIKTRRRSRYEHEGFFPFFDAFTVYKWQVAAKPPVTGADGYRLFALFRH